MSKSDQEVLQSEDDLEMMKRPHLWPHPFLLPLKRVVDDTLTTGYLLEGDGPVVRLGTIWTASISDEKVVYDSFDEVVRVGWRVD